MATRRCGTNLSLLAPTEAAGRPGWRDALDGAVTDAAELRSRLGLPSASCDDEPDTAASFPLLAPEPYLARIRPGDANDPLLLQILPRLEERDSPPPFARDPLGELAAVEGPCLLGKYPSRILILATPRCAVHCRFCFRRHFPPLPGIQEPYQREAILARIAADPSLREVILSGGDPLTCDDDLLADFAERLAAIPHVRRLRIHTRMPVAIPQRVDAPLLGWLRRTRLTPIMVVHVNHPAEVDDAVAAAFGRLVDAGVPVLSQTVLLRGVNDRIDVLAGLFDRLVDLRVMPYYLHQLDRVAGAAHFEVPIETGRRLIDELRARLPGYAVPRYVQELPSATSKRALG